VLGSCGLGDAKALSHGSVSYKIMNRAEWTRIAVKWFDGLVLTNPSTLGLLDEPVEEVALIIHGCGGLVYGDGANMNALMGAHRPRSVDDQAN